MEEVKFGNTSKSETGGGGHWEWLLFQVGRHSKTKIEGGGSGEKDQRSSV